jgi:hypothetical protein
MRLYYLLLMALLSGCGNSQEEVGAKMEHGKSIVDIKVGSSIDDLLKSSPMKFSEECMDTVGICWYKINLRSADPSLPTAVVNVDGTGLSIEKVTDISVVRSKGEKTIADFDLTLLGLPDDTSHDDNRKWIYNLLADFKSAGWSKYFYPADPRISGKEFSKLPAGKEVFGEYPLSHPMFDPTFALPLENWIAVKSFYNWYLYKDSAFAHVMVQRRDSDIAPSEKGTYLVTIEFTSQENTWKLDFKEEERADWKEKFPARLKELLQRRATAENLARAAGVDIEDGYRAPQIEIKNQK